MQLTVKTLSNQQYTLDTNGSDTIQQLKKRLNEAMTESSEQVVLIHDKTELADNQTVQECGLEHGATVFAVNRPSSSSPTPSEPHSKAADVNATSSNKADQPTTSTEVVPKRKGRKHPRCAFGDCTDKVIKIAGDCRYCNSSFCSRHRLPEAHVCSNLTSCKQVAHDRNSSQLLAGKCIASKV